MNITVDSPTSPWQVNGIDITLRNSDIINSAKDIIVLYKNSRDIWVENITANPLVMNKCFICNTEYDTGIENITVIQSEVANSINKKDPSIILHNIEGLILSTNTIVNVPSASEPIEIESVTEFVAENNNIIYNESPTKH